MSYADYVCVSARRFVRRGNSSLRLRKSPPCTSNDRPNTSDCTLPTLICNGQIFHYKITVGVVSQDNIAGCTLISLLGYVVELLDPITLGLPHCPFRPRGLATVASNCSVLKIGGVIRLCSRSLSGQFKTIKFLQEKFFRPSVVLFPPIPLCTKLLLLHSQRVSQTVM